MPTNSLSGSGMWSQNPSIIIIIVDPVHLFEWRLLWMTSG